MEKDNTMAPAWNSSDFGMDIHAAELNCGSGQLPNCFFNPNWDNSMDQSDPFESALSSMVSSPVASNGGGRSGGDGVVLRELIGRLGSICNSGEISSHSYNNIGSTNNSCYSTPLNSPPKLNLSIMDHQMRGSFQIPGNHLPSLTPFPADPGFAERAARFSSFGSRSFNGQFGLNESELPSRLGPRLESGNLSRISSNQSLKVAGSPLGVQDNTDGSPQDAKFSRLSRSSTPENAEMGDSREESSISEQIPGGEIGVKGQSDGNGRKRKAIPKGKAKETTPAKVAIESDGSNSKRSKSDEKEAEEENENGKANGNGKQKQTKESAKAPAEPPKDYIHVRARRGQATDSHSLAERVRREKISERMKFLQDLVPGCNKVTGKAVMLDEIINYVQSLQRQVEFLSMKLATVNPRTDLNMEALLSKDIFQSRGGSMPHNNNYPLETASPAFPYGYQQSLHMHSGIIPNGTMASPYSPAFTHLSAAGYGEAAASQASAFWGDDLHSVVQMGIGQDQAQTFHGTARMKVEL